MPASDEYIVEILRDVGLVTNEQIADARVVSEQKKLGSVVDALIQSGVLTQMQATQALASNVGMEAVSLRNMVIPQEVIDCVPRQVARRYKVVPVFKHSGGSLSVAISDPTDLELVDSLHYALKCTVEPMVAPRDEIEE